MTKRIFALALIFMMLFAVGCNKTDNGGDPSDNNTADGGDDDGTVEERNADGELFYRGTVSNVYANYIVIEIIDSQVAFGTYHVITDKNTVYTGSDGKTISRDSIKEGDTIDVIFSGQVMLSLPPQIYAQKVVLK